MLRSILFLLLLSTIIISCGNQANLKQKENIEEVNEIKKNTDKRVFNITNSNGEIVKAIKIGNQIWMAENLSVNTFRNGDSIYYARNKAEWFNVNHSKLSALCVLNDKESNSPKYGYLYNWYAINDSRGLAPIGWHVSTTEEWRELIKFLGGPDSAYAKIKSDYAWSGSNNGNNESGFNAIPSGFRRADWDFSNSYFGAELCAFWADGASSNYNSYSYIIDFGSNKFVSEIESLKSMGLSIRCLKD